MFLIPTLAIMALQPGVTLGATAIDRNDAEVVVCKTLAKTNTRFGNRTCRTRAEWARISEEQRRNAQEMIGAMRQNLCNGEGQCPGGR
jgi:hypothetical protein